MATAKKYHISPETGRPNQCTATVRGCKYSTNGEVPEHYDSKEEARAAAEENLSQEYGATSTLKKNSSATKKAKSNFDVPTRIETNGYTQNAWVGSRREAYNEKANGYLGAKDIATNIRQDVKDAVRAGYLPSDLKYSITTDKYAGGFAINAKVSGMGDVYDTHEYNPSRRGLELKSENQEVIDKLQAISDGWNYHDSDGSIDYFNSGFYGTIRPTTPYEDAYTDYDKSRKSFNKVLSQNKEQSEERTTETLEAEKDYFEKLHNVIQHRELENELFDAARKYDRNPDKEEYEKFKEVAELRAQVKVIEAKKKYGITA